MRRLRVCAAVTAAVAALLAACTGAESADDLAATGGEAAAPSSATAATTPASERAQAGPTSAAVAPADAGASPADSRSAPPIDAAEITPDVRRRVEWRLSATPEAMHSRRGGVELLLVELTLTSVPRLCATGRQASPVCADLDGGAQTVVTVDAVMANGTGHLMEVRPQRSTLVLDDRQVPASSFAGSPSPTLVAESVAGTFVWSTDVTVDAFRQQGVVEVRVEAPADPWVGDRSNALTARVEL